MTTEVGDVSSITAYKPYCSLCRTYLKISESLAEAEKTLVFHATHDHLVREPKVQLP